ncbi:MAG: tRNA pseudouridine(55) synthase TruB [Elusimicrobia bacterium]|nr:tRNA pseudouridine(55) synthase TruB [Elusimicrobiota bacterium]
MTHLPQHSALKIPSAGPVVKPGLLLLDKPKGWTSHDVVAAVRGRLPRGTKVGHTGTLDPMATGLLVLLVGPATREAARFQALPKVYSGSIRFGLETDTADLEGKVVSESPVPPVEAEALQRLLGEHVGDLELLPPLYSAIKHHGRPLYEYARRGLAVEVKPRLQRVYSWELLAWAPPEAAFRLSCSGGTYVRSLAVAVGRKLGCGAAVSALRREAVGSLRVEDAFGAEEGKRLGAGELLARLRPVPAAP